MKASDAITIANSSDGYPASWVRDTADTPAEATAPGIIPGSEEARVQVELREEWEKRCSALEERVRRLESVIILLISPEISSGFKKLASEFDKMRLATK